MLGVSPLSEGNPDCVGVTATECCKAEYEHGAKVEPERCFNVAVVTSAAAPAHLLRYKHLQSNRVKTSMSSRPASNLPLLLLCVGDEETHI